MPLFEGNAPWTVVRTLPVALARYFSCEKLHHHMRIRLSTLDMSRTEVKSSKLVQLLVADDG